MFRQMIRQTRRQTVKQTVRQTTTQMYGKMYSKNVWEKYFSFISETKQDRCHIWGIFNAMSHMAHLMA